MSTDLTFIIDLEIQKLIEDFEKYPDKYLTESDVRCFLVEKLVKQPEFSRFQKTEDGSESISLHTEIRWYGKSNKNVRYDIVIIDVSSLIVKDGAFKIPELPSKGFGFDTPLAIIEIKLRRVNDKSAFIEKINNDIKKLTDIKEEIDAEYPSYLVVLDKKRNIEEKLRKLIPQSTGIKLFYKSQPSNKTKSKKPGAN